MTEVNDVLETLSQILGRCVLIGFVFVTIWFCAFRWGSEYIYWQGQWFGLAPHECALMAYGGMGLAKLLVILFFLSPYIAIRWFLRKRGR